MTALRLMPERDCETCKRQQDWGCTAKQYFNLETGEGVWVNPAPIPLKMGGEDVYSCPRQPLREDPQWWNELFLYYNMYKKGFMPEDGGVASQTHRAIRLFQLVDELQTECDQAIKTRQREAQNRSTVLGQSRPRG